MLALIPYRASLVASLFLVALAPAGIAAAPQRKGVRLIPPLPPTADVTKFACAGSRCVYVADAEVNERFELYGIPRDGSAQPVKLSGTLVTGGDVLAIALTDDGRRAVYLADQVTNGRTELWSVPAAGGPPPVKLSGTLTAGGNVGVFRLLPDDSGVYYFADQDTDGMQELYLAPLDGSAPAVTLNPPLVPTGMVSSLSFATPDSSRIVYLASQDLHAFEVFSVPLDGSFAPVKLNAPLVADRFATGLWIAPDGTRAVWVVNQDAPGVPELFSAPVDGSAPAVKLSGPLAAGGQVSALAVISPDSSRVLYLADQDADEVHELYSAPLDGSAAAVKLNGPLAAGGDVEGDLGATRQILIDPSSARVVYRADQEQDGVYELFGVPLDGSAPAVKLSGGFAHSGADARDFVAVAPGGCVLYTADALVDEQYELFVAPLDGSAAPVRLSAPLVAGGDVAHAFDLAADGASVFYRADQEVDGVLELYRVPLDASAPPVRASGATAGGIASFVQVLADELVYAADAAGDGVVELFGSFLVPPRRHESTPTVNVDRAL